VISGQWGRKTGVQDSGFGIPVHGFRGTRVRRKSYKAMDHPAMEKSSFMVDIKSASCNWGR
jgi:hypothetical protein